MSANETQSDIAEDLMSFTDKIKNTAEELSGKIKERVGGATGNRDLQAEGNKDNAKGNLKNAGEDVKDTFKG